MALPHGALPLLVFEHEPIRTRRRRPPEAMTIKIFLRCSCLAYWKEEDARSRHPPCYPRTTTRSASPPHKAGSSSCTAPTRRRPGCGIRSPKSRESIPLPPIRDDHYIPTKSACYLTHSFTEDPVCDPDMWFCRINGGITREWAQHTHDVGEYTLPVDDDGDGDSASTPPTKRAIAGDVAALGGKLHFIFSESNQYKMGVVHLHFGTPAPTAELRTLEDVNAAITLPEGMCGGVTRLLESQGELFQVCVCFREFNPNDIGAVLVLKMDFDYGAAGAGCMTLETGSSCWLMEPVRFLARRVRATCKGTVSTS
ncbi:hypothetical protein ZWY2020_037424 [Hordeum vulgare]|nr:hypothetical protein ZWY2020_037424 [Hordeum vulgare]